MKNNKVTFVLIALIMISVICLGLSLTKNLGKTSSTVNMENSLKKLNALYKDINVKTYDVKRGATFSDEEKLAILPDISEYPFIVNPTTDSFITIYVSTDIANEQDDSWLRTVAEEFNNSNIEIDEIPVSVGIRAIPSNVAVDFITTEKYVPDAYIPASDIYKMFLDNAEKRYSVVSESILNNVSGVIMSKKIKNSISSKYNNDDINTYIESVLKGECIIGYTNPLSNEDGLNYILTLLNTFDKNNPFSNDSIERLQNYQDKIPYVSYEVTQLEESIQNGTIDGFASNYQYYYTSPDLRNSYDFIPFGIEQNHPVYEIGELTDLKREILSLFVENCVNSDSQKKATNLGFNNYADYSYVGYGYRDKDVLDAQNIWKKEKNGSSDLTAVFVADISGSMEGSPLLKLKASLNRASSFIDDNTNIGLVTFSDDVNIILPIKKFDDIQKSYFVNAVKSMRASGGTAMFNAIVVAQHMLMEEYKNNPNTRPMLFVLTDGESNRGYKLADIEEITRDLRIPIYTIGYNANIEELKTISDINEASTMDADSDNVIYKLEDLFNAQM